MSIKQSAVGSMAVFGYTDTLFEDFPGWNGLPGDSIFTMSEFGGILMFPMDQAVKWPGRERGDTHTSTVGREKPANNPYVTLVRSA